MTKIVVHSIRMGDVEDPDLFVAEPIYAWQQTESGKWIMKNSIDPPMWKRRMEYHGYVYDIIADLKDIDLTYWKLKYE